MSTDGGGRLPLRIDWTDKNRPIQPVYEPFTISAATEDHRFDDSNQWRMAYLGKLLQTDRARVPALLHDWEEFTVNAFKLNKYWTRTPFPCEG